jgi:hypothetical protein
MNKVDWSIGGVGERIDRGGTIRESVLPEEKSARVGFDPARRSR